jgi:hypothetical protein
VEAHVLDEGNEARVIHIVEKPTDVEQKDANLKAIGMRRLDIMD